MTFEWTFEINDVVKFSETHITIYSNTYEDAIKKIRDLKLPDLRTYTDIEDRLKLINVHECEEITLSEPEN